MADLIEIERHCNTLLRVDRFKDYCPNGVQVDAGVSEVKRIATAVTASQAAIEAAADWRADLLLVHHGYFWKGEPGPLTGIKGRRIRALISAGMSLMAYHLPLDAHMEMGNNRGLGDALGLAGAPLEEDGLLWQAELSDSLSGEALVERLQQALGHSPFHLPAEGDISKLVWCTGAAQGQIEQAALLGAQGFISGEVSEQTYHQARELGIHYFAAGHHATERFGVRSLGEYLSKTFAVEYQFFDEENPF